MFETLKKASEASRELPEAKSQAKNTSPLHIIPSHPTRTHLLITNDLKRPDAPRTTEHIPNGFTSFQTVLNPPPINTLNAKNPSIIPVVTLISSMSVTQHTLTSQPPGKENQYTAPTKHPSAVNICTRSWYAQQSFHSAMGKTT
ncbi:hypothetical protein MMC21_004272 [Puttea exsequens]|nr:hypothetical protein [Puttea exsequens]